MCCFLEFDANDGSRYCIAGTSDQAILSMTKNGLDPCERFNCPDSLKKFLRYREITERDLLKNYPQSFHYVERAVSLLSGSCPGVFWIGTSSEPVHVESK
ncbi:MAG: hypothetical protein WCF92_01720 [bacterium]